MVSNDPMKKIDSVQMTLKEFAKRLKAEDLMDVALLYEWFKRSGMTFEEFMRDKGKENGGDIL